MLPRGRSLERWTYAGMNSSGTILFREKKEPVQGARAIRNYITNILYINHTFLSLIRLFPFLDIRNET
jgi:hypothetical protein